MEKAKFYVYGDNPKDVVQTVIAASQDEAHRFSLFSWDGEKGALAEGSFLALLHPTAREAMLAAAGVDTLQGLFRKIDGAEITPEDALAGAAVTNPYRWFMHNLDGSFSEVTAETENQSPDAPKEDTSGATLALTALPPGLPRGQYGDNSGFEKVVDVRIGFFDSEGPTQTHRMPGRHGGPTFLRRNRLKEVLDTPNARQNHRVHIIVVDQGMDPGFVNTMGDDGPINGDRTYAQILWNTSAPHPHPAPGLLPNDHIGRYRSRPQWHAHMIVRNILATAGDNRRLQGGQPQRRMIRIYDVPAVPDRVTSVLGTAAEILMQYQAIQTFIDNRRLFPPNDRAIIVNAWGIKDRFRETPLGDLTETESHALNAKIASLAHDNRVEVVFAAGNNGLFTADPQTGALDRGPGRSIFLPAALPDVWATGASDANGTWIGLSSQGPAIHDSTIEKPDFNVPSHFCEDMDAHVTNTGSSASCAILAGMIADHWRHNNGQRPDLPGARSKARKRGQTKRSNRLGAGIPQYKKIR